MSCQCDDTPDHRPRQDLSVKASKGADNRDDDGDDDECKYDVPGPIRNVAHPPGEVAFNRVAGRSALSAREPGEDRTGDCRDADSNQPGIRDDEADDYGCY